MRHRREFELLAIAAGGSPSAILPADTQPITPPRRKDRRPNMPKGQARKARLTAKAYSASRRALIHSSSIDNNRTKPQAGA
jgi:hypothetical protein